MMFRSCYFYIGNTSDVWPILLLKCSQFLFDIQNHLIFNHTISNVSVYAVTTLIFRSCLKHQLKDIYEYIKNKKWKSSYALRSKVSKFNWISEITSIVRRYYCKKYILFSLKIFQLRISFMKISKINCMIFSFRKIIITTYNLILAAIYTSWKNIHMLCSFRFSIFLFHNEETYLQIQAFR